MKNTYKVTSSYKTTEKEAEERRKKMTEAMQQYINIKKSA